LSSEHIPMSLRASLNPLREVYAAWEEYHAEEERMQGVRAGA